jgi:hypothetical protein
MDESGIPERSKSLKSFIGRAKGDPKMSEPAMKKATYDDLHGIPENMTGEIIAGELIVTPRPSPEHSNIASSLGYKIGPPYHFGEAGGPGGWIILFEPEIKFSENDLLVPDLAGWRKNGSPDGLGKTGFQSHRTGSVKSYRHAQRVMTESPR